MTSRFVQPFSLLAILVALVAQRSAVAGVHIHPVFNPALGLPPKPGIVAGKGDLQEIFQVAAEAWERVFDDKKDNWHLTIEFGWSPLGNDNYAQERKQEQGGNPVRITRSLVTFNNAPILLDGVEGYFADPTPRDNSEYQLYNTFETVVDKKKVNFGRVFSQATGQAVNRIDLLTLAMHEIGHALGLDSFYVGYQTRIVQGLYVEVASPPKYKGLEITINTSGQHINDAGRTALMYQKIESGRRLLVSVADALVLSRLSLVDRPNLKDPTKGNQEQEDREE